MSSCQSSAVRGTLSKSQMSHTSIDLKREASFDVADPELGMNLPSRRKSFPIYLRREKSRWNLRLRSVLRKIERCPTLSGRFLCLSNKYTNLFDATNVNKISIEDQVTLIFKDFREFRIFFIYIQIIFIRVSRISEPIVIQICISQ